MLTPKQEAFCQEYIVDLNATQAAIRCGYSEKTAAEQASRLLSLVKVKTRVQGLMDARAKRVEVTADYVLNTIVETIERCRQSVRPKLNRSGEHELTETPDGEGLAFVFDAGNALRGAELLGKHLKLFTDKIEHSGHIHTDMTDEELDRAIAERRAALEKASRD